MKKILYSAALIFVIFAFNGCQDMNHPALGDYPKDVNPVGGPLKFYASFDGTTDDSLFNAVDSILANFASMNSTVSIDGISGKAIEGGVGKYVSYAKPNDFATTAGSFTVSFWEKHDGQTHNNALTNGPEYPFSFVTPSSYNDLNTNFFVLFEGNNTACAVKMYVAAGLGSNGKNISDTWLVWQGSNAISGILDNQWHHCAFVYDQTTSTLTFYVDGAPVSQGTQTWSGHGTIGLENSMVNSLRIGCGPTGDETDVSDSWTSSTWKGGLDQFRMYATALTASEVSELYTSKK